MHWPPFFWQFDKFAGGNLLLFGICDTRCRPFSFLVFVILAADNALLISGFVAFGTGEGLLWYGICAPCSKRLPGVRDAFSEAFGVKNRLLRYGMDIRCAEQPPVVRDASGIFGIRPPPSGTEQDSLNRKRVSLALLRN